MTTQNEQVTIAMAAAVQGKGALAMGKWTAAPMAIVTSTFNSG
jgi:hypothetical protein